MFKSLSQSSQNSTYQGLIDAYRQNFTLRSKGFILPPIKYVGNFQSKIGSHISPREKVFVAIAVKNQANLIVSIVDSLCKHINVDFQIGLLFDNCQDKSETQCLEYFENMFEEFENLTKVHFIRSDGELFEATCENILSLYCEADFFMSLQADMFFKDYTFVARCLKFFSDVPNLFAISGRAIVRLSLDSKVSQAKKLISKITRRILALVKHGANYEVLGPYLKNLDYFGDVAHPPYSKMNFTRKEFEKVFFGESVIRGPIIWKSEIYKKLNGLDDLGHVLGRDECDLCFRAGKSGYIVGYLPCLCFSFPEMGTSRKARNLNSVKALQQREKLAAENPSDLSNFWTRSQVNRKN